MPAPGLCGVRDVRIERPDGRNHTGRGCRGGGGRKHIELAGDPEGREINMARRPVAGAARLGSVRLFVDVTGRYRTLALTAATEAQASSRARPGPVELARQPERPRQDLEHVHVGEPPAGENARAGRHPATTRTVAAGSRSRPRRGIPGPDDARRNHPNTVPRGTPEKTPKHSR